MRLSLPALFLGSVLSVTALPEPVAAQSPAAAEAKDAAGLEKLTNSATTEQKNALLVAREDIGAALARKPHVDAVVALLEQAGGTYTKVNRTPAALKEAFGGQELPLFVTLTMVNLSNPALGIKGKREVDPFTHAFYEHLGEIHDLESLTILNTTAQNADLAPLAKLTSLKRLDIVNQGKLNDEGLACLAPLKQLERFGFIGTQMTGAAFSKFEGWAQLKSVSFRGSKIDDEGLRLICERFPSLESLVLAHADFTDQAAPNLAKLPKLRNLEIGTHKATVECLRNLVGLPIEYLQLGEQLGAPACVPIISQIKTLRRLTITDARAATGADLAQYASLKQLEHLELGSADLAEERAPQMKPFAFLKSMRLVRGNKPYAQEVRAKVQEALPGVKIAWE